MEQAAPKFQLTGRPAKGDVKKVGIYVEVTTNMFAIEHVGAKFFFTY
jgi:hypothetical protein